MASNQSLAFGTGAWRLVLSQKGEVLVTPRGNNSFAATAKAFLSLANLDPRDREAFIAIRDSFQS